MMEPGARRPIASRNTRLAKSLARSLASTAITPNQISMGSMVAAAIAGGSFWASAFTSNGPRVALLLLAAVACQARLICNLMDGLVAIESGKRAADGAFWNEFPDRVADILIIAGLGLAASSPTLGWAAASMAILTAYTRELGQSCGAPVDFSGPMAKPHRMALVTFAAIAAVLEEIAGMDALVLHAALWVLVLGAALTTVRRAGRIVSYLRNAGEHSQRPERNHLH